MAVNLGYTAVPAESSPAAYNQQICEVLRTVRECRQLALYDLKRRSSVCDIAVQFMSQFSPKP